MSTVLVTIEEVKAVEPHPNATSWRSSRFWEHRRSFQRGSIVRESGLCSSRPTFCCRPTCRRFLASKSTSRPPRSVVSGIPCRVAACRLRGQPSYGFIAPIGDYFLGLPVGGDVTDAYGVKSMSRPLSTAATKATWSASCRPSTSTRRSKATTATRTLSRPARRSGSPRRLHGTNCRVGRIYDGEWRFMGGSHKTTRKPYDAAGKPSLYWRPLMDDNVQSLLRSLCGEKHNVIVFGELFGPGIQDLDYGQQEVAFRVFDISVDGVYLNWHSVQNTAASLTFRPFRSFTSATLIRRSSSNTFTARRPSPRSSRSSRAAKESSSRRSVNRIVRSSVAG